MNSITELLNIEDNNLRITNISIEGSQKTITLETLSSVLPAASVCILKESRCAKSGILFCKTVTS